MRQRVLAAIAALVLTGPAHAIDPGTASGHYAGKETRVPKLTHAVALRVDNAEGRRDRQDEMRILLSEEDVPASALAGLHFPPVRTMALAGRVHGLLLEFDPADRTTLSVNVLAKPANPGQMLTSLSLPNSGGLWTRLDVQSIRVTGELKPNETFDLVASFSAPVFTNPVQRDLKGAAARESEPVRVLLARVEAIGRGDLATAQSLSTAAAAERLSAMPVEAMKAAAAHIPELVRQLKAARRVVVRERTAAVEVPDGSWFSLARENGVWKAAD